jgi:large subunit ribosomal protein L19
MKCLFGQNNKKKLKMTSNKELIKSIETKYLKNENFLDKKNPLIEIGNIIRIGYLIPEGEKERTQYYEGLVIAIKNKGIGKSFLIRRNVQGIGIEQIFLLNSPKIISIVKKQGSKVRRSKLYFLRELRGKSTRLKIKF